MSTDYFQLAKHVCYGMPLEEPKKPLEDELTDEEWEDAVCTCDIEGEDCCPAHYPIDDGPEDDEL